MPYSLEAIQGLERDRYLQDIQDDLDSIAPRIAYAEWLQGKGLKDRAQCILLQISLHKLTTEEHGNAELSAQERNRLEAVAELEQDLWKVHGKEWQAAENPPSNFLKNVEWDRGFPYFGTVDWQSVDKTKLREAMGRFPIQGLVVLNVSRNDIGALLQEPWIPQLRHLILEGNALGDDGAQAITESEKLSKLQYLNLSQCGIGVAGAKVLAQSENLKGLRVLRLRGNDITLDSVYALAEASQKNLSNLWKITVRKKVDGHDPEEFYGQIDEARMAQCGFMKSLEGGQTWQKETLPSTEEQKSPAQSPEDVQMETILRLRSVLAA